MSKTECENGPPGGPVDWYARKRGQKRKIRCKGHQTWFRARDEAMRRLSVDQTGVEVWQVGDDPPT